MHKTPRMGKNRTGIQMSPQDTKKMLEEAKGAVYTSGDDRGIMEVRKTYIEASGPVGTVPPPGTARGAVKSGIKALTGKKAHVLVDRMGERLAFERTGTRLYDALIAKCQADSSGSPYVAQLQHIRAEEAAHFKLLVEWAEKLGADPTAQTPAADVTGVESAGLMQVVTDPMTSVTQSLHSVLVAELADNDAWDELILLAQEMGQNEMAREFEAARTHEREHLATLRQWHQEATMQESRAA